MEQKQKRIKLKERDTHRKKEGRHETKENGIKERINQKGYR